MKSNLVELQISKLARTNGGPEISIIIPVHNRSDYLDSCLASIRAQEGISYEIIVVDDGSSDDLSHLRNEVDHYIRYGANVGPAFARNLGVSHSIGKYLLFLDSDAELRPGALQQLPSIFESDPTLGAVGGSGPPDASGKDVKFISAKAYDYFGRSEITQYRPQESEHGIHDCHHLEAAFLALPRQAFEKIGGFDPEWGYMGEDRDLCLRLKDEGYRVVACLDTRAIHHNLGVEQYSDKSRPFTNFFYRKCQEVAIKRDGLWGGIRWLCGHPRVALKPSYLADLWGGFKAHRRLAKRRTADHLASDQMDQYYCTKAAETLDKRLPFDVRYPLRSPRHVVFFVNAVCNALCDHCFIIHDELPQQDRRQIPLDNVLATFRSMNAPTRISLTGGEPFIRKDLQQMIDELMKLPHTRDVSLFSNGSTPEHIEKVCRQVCEKTSKRLNLQLSLDGLEDRHDEIRKIPQGFQKVLETCDRLQKLGDQRRNFSFVVAITVMKQNLAEMQPLVDQLEELGYPSKLSIVRGNSFSTFDVPADIFDGEVEPNAEVLVDVNETEKTLEQIGHRHPQYFDQYQTKKLKIMLDTLKNKRREFKCYAGYEDAVVYNDGSVAICEQVIPFGNLESWNWDFLQAWNSRPAMEHRLKLTQCGCIHGCNISTSIGMQAEEDRRRKGWFGRLVSRA